MKKITPALLAALLLAATSLPAPASTPPTATQPATPHDFPAYGIRFTPPTGWKRVAPTAVDTIAKWVSLDSTGNVLASLLIQHRKIHGTLLDDERDIQTRMTLTSLRPLSTFDGQAFWAKGSSPTAASVQEFDSRHDNVGYRVTLSRTIPAPPGEDDATMNAFIESWHFRSLEEPWEHPLLAKNPLSVDANFLITVPTNARPEPLKSDTSGPRLALINLKTQTIELRIHAATRPAPVPTPEIMAANLQSQLAPGESLRFTNLGNNRLLSAWAKSDKFTPPMYMAIAIVPIANNQSAIVNFFMERNEPTVQAAYLALAQKIVLSIQPAPPSVPPTTTALLQ